MLARAAAMLAGVACAMWGAFHPWLAIALLGTVAALMCIGHQPRRIVGFFLGGLLACGWQLYDTRAARVERAREAVIAGCVASAVRVDGNRLRFDLAGVALAHARGGRRVRVAWYAPRRVPAAGECWRLRVRLRPPRGLVNFFGDDRERSLFAARVAAVATVRGGVAGQRLSAAGWRTPLLRLRLGLAARVRFAAGEAGFAPLYAALTVGLRDGLTDAHWRTLNATGTGHLVAISGLHVGLVAGAGFLLGRLVGTLGVCARRARECGCAGALVAALTYAALAGFSLPTLRALTMVAAFVGAAWLRVRLATHDTLALALVIVLSFMPLSVLEPGLWLSFGAVAALLTAGGGSGLWSGQWRVFAGLLPVLAVLTGRVSWVGPWANAVSVPLFSFVVVPSVLVAGAVAVIEPRAGAVLYTLLDDLLAPWWRTAAAAAVTPASVRAVAAPAPWAVVFAVAGAASLLAVAATWRARVLAVLACVPLLAARPPAPRHGSFAIDIFDAGQSLAVAVRTRRHALLYDAGGRWRRGDAGARIVVPQLRARGIDRRWALVISHADLDHRGGAASVRRAMPVARVFAGEPGTVQGDSACRAGRRWTVDGVAFEFLHPHGGRGWSGNNASCVLSVRGAHGRALLTGDIEGLAELALVHGGADLRADAVIGQHHGSRTSSGAAFVTATGARWVVFATGFDNRWSLPAAAVVERWRAHGAQTLSTADHGAVTLSFGAGGVRARLARAERAAAWRVPPPP